MTKMGMTRQSSPKPLKRRTPLKARKGLNKMSVKAKAEQVIWQDIKDKRIMALLRKFGYVPCEYCKEQIDAWSSFNYAEGHHNNHNRRDNSFGNCRILHRVCNQLISDKNIKDVPSLL